MSLNKRAEEVASDIYIVALFLNPPYRENGTSKIYSLLDVSRMILELAHRWDFTEYEATQIYNTDIKAYSNNVRPHSSTEHDPIKYWKAITRECPCLSKLALIVFSLIPSSASVESLFSKLNAAKLKARNRLSKQTLSIIGRIKLDHYNNSMKRKENGQQPQLAGWSFDQLTDLVERESIEDDPEDLYENETEAIETPNVNTKKAFSISDTFNYYLDLYSKNALDKPINQTKVKWTVKDITKV